MSRNTFLPFALPDIDQTDIDQVVDTLKSGWITTGPKTREFESRFAKMVGAKHAVALNSCTAAMHLALEAINLKPDDEVIMSPYTFAATAEVVRYFDATPVLVDVFPTDLNIDTSKIEDAITENTKAIMPIHIAGQSADLETVYAIAEQHGLAVIEDAAHAFPTMYQGKMIGSYQRENVRSATCFSFYATKTLTTAEGGMLCTDDDEIAARCRIMAIHGISKDAFKRYTSEGSWYYEVVAPGFKYNMTDVASSMGLSQLEKAETMRAKRWKIAKTYTELLSDLPQLTLPSCANETHCCNHCDSKSACSKPSECGHAWHLYMLRLNLDSLKLDRAEFIQALREHNIGASVHFIPLHVHPYYRDKYGYKPEDFPVAYHEYCREISLPIYTTMSQEDVHDVVNAVRDIILNNSL